MTPLATRPVVRVRSTCSVVVCCYTEQRWTLLLAAVNAAVGQLRDGDEVLVVVDHNEALLTRLASALPDGVRLLPNHHGQGLSGARNTGVEASAGDVVVFLDDDAVGDKDVLDRLVQPFDDADVQVVGGRAEAAWETGRPAWWPTEFDWVVGCHYRGLPTGQAEVRNVMGAVMAVRREAFDVVGAFVEGVGRSEASLPMGCEETELCIRLRQAVPATKVLLEPGALVLHHVPAARGSLRYFVRRCWAEGLSKAQVTEMVGSQDGLASERTYVTRTLPRAVAGGLLDAARGRAGGLGRAAAVVVGLGATGLGYVVGRSRLG